MKPEDTNQQAQDTEKVTAALMRAAKLARKLAQQTCTELVFMRDGKLVREVPTGDQENSDTAQSA